MPITTAELIEWGLSADDAAKLGPRVNSALAQPAPAGWLRLSREVLRPENPFVLHRNLFARAYRDWPLDAAPPPAWSPDPDTIRQTNVGRLMDERGFQTVAELHAWSVARRSEFWQAMLERLEIRFSRKYDCVLDAQSDAECPRWLPGARMNIVESCFGAEPDKPAIVYHDEGGGRESLSYAALAALSNRVANGAVKCGLRPGDAVAIDLPMNVEAVAIYLGLIKAGCVAVSVADSLAAEEIAVRLRLSNAQAVFTQDVILRGGKELPLYAKVVDAAAPRTIVISSRGAALRPGDVSWKSFLSDREQFMPHQAHPQEHTNILFSSGTTGEPKAIPWTHTTPIKCAVDALLHQDVQPHDRLAWPTNLGWMMGPWLIYASLINRATMTLYGGAPTGRDFGQFVADAGVTMLGVIPSLVKTWRAADCMRGVDWSAVTRFSSTGECSNADDMLYLMSLAGYRPVIEYCGGTELGGGYIGATMAQANAPSTFSTPSFGTGLEFVAEGEHNPQEVFLMPPAIGMSTELLHHDHHQVYYDDAPRGPSGEALRRHGDALERLPGGYYRALGRTDDTMNLGGIKVSSVEIERAANTVDEISETAAIAVTPPGGGPSQLWLFAVLNSECRLETAELKRRAQDAIRQHLNPLFKIHSLVPIEALPRTPSNKIMRRLLRDKAAK